MEVVRCKRCNRVLRSKESIKLGYGKKCYRIISLQEENKIIPGGLEELLDRVRKLELDNTFMKHQLKHKSYTIGQNVEAIERIKHDHHRPERNVMKVQFNVIVKELKVVFHEGFDYHEVLKPIDVRETPEDPPHIVDSIEILN